ncbi:MAG TPA: transglutaminase domain-containing protein, partial [Kofleriaceae bacterium]|nr:transglutaminase domain-containing protein [Kofleriaceae bacterium]
MRWTSVVFLAACAAGTPRPPGAGDAPEVGRDAARDYAIWLGGAQVGTAHEVERWSPAGVVVQRTEAMRFLRGDVPVAITTAIEITADPALAPTRVTWTERARAVRRGEAVRGAAGWTVTDDAGVRRLPAAAIPAELAPYLVRRDGRFAGQVFLPARGFVAGTGRIEPVAPRRLVARLAFPADPATAGGAAAATAAPPPAAAAEATIDLGDDAMPVRVVDGEGVIAIRITAAEAAIPFAPVDLIAATAIPLTDAPTATSPGPPGAVGRPPIRRLVLEGDLAIPPVPGQQARPLPDGAELELSSRLRGGLPPGPAGPDRTRDIISLVARVHGRIAPDLAALPASARAAAAATTGDCTTFALAYAALAGDRGIPTRVVTGFRVDGDRLVRHRWAVSWTGGAWIAVDAAFGAVPAGGDLVGLA